MTEASDRAATSRFWRSTRGHGQVGRVDGQRRPVDRGHRRRRTAPDVHELAGEVGQRDDALAPRARRGRPARQRRPDPVEDAQARVVGTGRRPDPAHEQGHVVAPGQRGDDRVGGGARRRRGSPGRSAARRPATNASGVAYAATVPSGRAAARAAPGPTAATQPVEDPASVPRRASPREAAAAASRASQSTTRAPAPSTATSRAAQPVVGRGRPDRGPATGAERGPAGRRAGPGVAGPGRDDAGLHVVEVGGEDRTVGVGQLRTGRPRRPARRAR